MKRAVATTPTKWRRRWFVPRYPTIPWISDLSSMTVRGRLVGRRCAPQLRLGSHSSDACVWFIKNFRLATTFSLECCNKTRHSLGGRIGRRNFGSPQERVAKYGLKPNRLFISRQRFAFAGLLLAVGPATGIFLFSSTRPHHCLGAPRGPKNSSRLARQTVN